jgi:hypothetical protein
MIGMTKSVADTLRRRRVADSGFSVFIDDVDRAGKVFQQASQDYAKLMPGDTFDCPSTGDGGLDAVLKSAVHTIGEIHKILGQALEQHGLKLGVTADMYRYSERDSNITIAVVMDRMVHMPAPGLNAPPKF